MRRGSYKQNYLYVIAIIVLVSLCCAGFIYAGKTKDENSEELPIPRFVTLSAKKVNVRIGPGVRYPITLVFKKDGLPVEIIKEFDVWRQIQSFDGEKGWVHQSLLSGRRSVIIKDIKETIYKNPNYNAKPVVKLELGVIASMEKCNSSWCKILVAGYEGWVEKKHIWGVYPEEIISE